MSVKIQNRTHLEFPAAIRPKPNKDRFHRIIINDTVIQITTYEGLYGNKERSVLVTIPPDSLREIAYVSPKPLLFKGRCRLIYSDEVGKLEQIEFSVIDFKQNYYTSVIADHLKSIWQNRKGLPPQDWRLTLARPKRYQKFFFGLFLFANVLIGGSLSFGASFLLGLGAFLLPASLVALSIDYILFNTGWPRLLKILATISVFSVAFILFVAALALFELF